MMDMDEVEILLVEDNSTDAELTTRALRKHNFANHLFWVKDGAEALDFIFAAGAYAGRNTKHAPKVILLDLRLPKLDGLEVLQKIKEDERTKLIPVVVITSSQDQEDIKTSYKLGVNSYINKPIQFEEFVKTISDTVLYWFTYNKTAV